MSFELFMSCCAWFITGWTTAKYGRELLFGILRVTGVLVPLPPDPPQGECTSRRPPVAAAPHEPLPQLGPASTAAWQQLVALEASDRIRYFALHGALIKPIDWGQA